MFYFQKKKKNFCAFENEVTTRQARGLTAEQDEQTLKHKVDELEVLIQEKNILIKKFAHEIDTLRVKSIGQKLDGFDEENSDTNTSESPSEDALNKEYNDENYEGVEEQDFNECDFTSKISWCEIHVSKKHRAPCDKCGETLFNPEDLRDHVNAHTEDDFACSECNAFFNSHEDVRNPHKLSYLC